MEDRHHAELQMKAMLMDVLDTQQPSQALDVECRQSEMLAADGDSVGQGCIGQRDCIDEGVRMLRQQLKQSAKYWIDLLCNDALQSKISTIVVNDSVTISKVYYQITHKISAKRYSDSPGDCFEHKYISHTSRVLVAEILDHEAGKLVACFRRGKRLLSEQTGRIDEQIKKNGVMNTYILFAMLKQMASSSETAILREIQITFPQLADKARRQFCRYVQANYECLDLVYNADEQPRIFSQTEQHMQQRYKNRKWLKYLRKCFNRGSVKLKRLCSQEGDQGFLLVKRPSLSQKQSEAMEIDHPENNVASVNHTFDQFSEEDLVSEQSEVDDDQELIFRVGEDRNIKVTNVKTCQRSWQVLGAKDSIDQIYHKLKQELQKQGAQKQKQYVSYGVQTCAEATIGGSLGRCLADINQYNNPNQFFIALSKTTVLYGSLSLAMAEIPILSYLIIAGGFTYSFYMTFKNEATSGFKKANQIGQVTMTAFGSVGSTLGGIFVGQALIPVPFLGAFIGGVFGGFFGIKGVRKLTGSLAQFNFRDIISYLKMKQIGKCYWKCTKYLLEYLGINQKYFNQAVPDPQDETKRDVYVTAICFCVVSFYQSQRYISHNRQKMQELEKQKRGVKLIVEEEVAFLNQFDLVGIVDFLTRNQFSILDNMDKLTKFISHLIQ